MAKSKLLLLTVALCAQINVLAQGGFPLATQVESAVKKQEPTWKLKGKRSSKMSAYFSWETGKSFANVFIVSYPSPETADKALDISKVDHELHSVEIRVFADEVPNLGDRNYLWEGLHNKDFKGVSFKKGRVVVHVSGSSFEVAKRFGQHIADALPDS